jgi:recombination protein RecA
MVPQKEHGNQLIDVMETYLRSGIYDVFVLDSIAALLPKEEREKAMDAGSYGAEQAKLMSKALRKLTAANKKTAIVYINQTRDVVGSMFGPRQMTSGGRAMAFYAGMRLEFIRGEQIKKKTKAIAVDTGDEQQKDYVSGHRVVVRLDKNKVGGSKVGDQVTFVFDYEQSRIDPIEDVIYLGRRLGWVHKKTEGRSDVWWLEGHEKKRGRSGFKRWLETNPDIVAELEDDIRNVEYVDEEEE